MNTGNDTVRQILLVGTEQPGGIPANLPGNISVQTCDHLSEAAKKVADSPFCAVFVQMASFRDELIPGLEALRAASDNTRIYLLSRMHEEIQAKQIVQTIYNNARLVDDYFICPITPIELQDAIGLQQGPHIDPLCTKTLPADNNFVISQLARLVMQDELTGLKNRRYVREFLKQIIERSRQFNLQATVLLFDIDNFKHYNDVYGHAIGDTILKQAGVLMHSCCRAHDVVARIGGDEFAVIFWDIPPRPATTQQDERRLAQAEHPTDAYTIAERFRKKLSSAKLAMLGPDGKGLLTISGGLASFPRDGTTVAELFVQADAALFEAKRSGKNRIYLVGEPANFPNPEP
ncbi:MAG: GGDEF domain-containing protein [Planctomycetota bacterium]